MLCILVLLYDIHLPDKKPGDFQKRIYLLIKIKIIIVKVEQFVLSMIH